MRSRFLKIAAFAASVAGVAFAASAPAKADFLPGLTNLDFSQYTGSDPKNCFQCVNPTGWSGGSGLIYIDSPVAGKDAVSGNGGLPAYYNPGPLVGNPNYVEADGNPGFESSFSVSLSGLEVGKAYELIFYQAAGQMQGYANGLDTTEQWIVSLGTSGLTFCFSCGAADSYYGGNDSTYSNPDPNASIVATNLMHTPSAGLTDWNEVDIFLTADAETDLLSFLAWANNGNTVNLPPLVFLTGVDTPNLLPPTGAPEPVTLSLFGAGLAGGVWARRRAKNKTKA